MSNHAHQSHHRFVQMSDTSISPNETEASKRQIMPQNHVSYCPETNTYAYANGNIPRFLRDNKVTHNGKCWRHGSQIKKDIQSQNEMLQKRISSPTVTDSGK
eukprot:1011312_1